MNSLRRFLIIFLGLILLSNLLQAQLISTLDVSHYDLTLELIHPERKILKGVSELQFTTSEVVSDSVDIHLFALNIDSAYLDNVKVSGMRRVESSFRLALPKSLELLKEYKLKIWYSGTPELEPMKWGGFHFDDNISYNLGIGFESNPHNFGRSWFPCIDNFTDRATYTYHIYTAPNRKATCGGVLVSQENCGDTAILWTWHMDKPIVAYLASVAVADYKDFWHTYHGIERDIPVGIYALKSDSAYVANYFSRLDEFIRAFEDAYGPYPFNRIGYCSTTTGAMEHAGNIALGNFGKSSKDVHETLMSHELAHMWFGNLITCASQEDMWLNEGWATFSQMYASEALYGRPTYLSEIKSTYATVITKAAKEDGGYIALNSLPWNLTYGTSAYKRGGMVAHTLRTYMGDELFFKALKYYFKNYGWSSRDSHEFCFALSQGSGMDLNGFFEGYVYNGGMPSYRVDSLVVSPASTLWATKCYIRQQVWGTPSFFPSNMVPLRFVGGSGEQKDTSVYVYGQFAVLDLNLPFKPIMVYIDPDYLVLMNRFGSDYTIDGTTEVSPSNLSLALSGGGSTVQTTLHADLQLVAPDGFKSPHPGYELSKQRYWVVQGVVPEGSSITGRFFYSKTNKQDDSIITSQEDTLIIMYRKNASEEWSRISSLRMGSWQAGSLKTTNLIPGEYALASKKPGASILSPSSSGKLNIYPNPANDKVRIELPGVKGILQIFSSSGLLLLKMEITKGEEWFVWDTDDRFSGLALITFQPSHDQFKRYTGKVLIDRW